MKAIIALFVKAREIQSVEHRQAVQISEETRQQIVARQQRAEDILRLTAKFGGDFGKAVAEYYSAKAQSFVDGHRHQRDSAYFRSREDALVKLGEQKNGNPVLEALFEDLFIETAVEAINRHYSNCRGFYFMSPFIGGMVMNKTQIPVPWKHGNANEIEAAIKQNLA